MLFGENNTAPFYLAQSRPPCFASAWQVPASFPLLTLLLTLIYIILLKELGISGWNSRIVLCVLQNREENRDQIPELEIETEDELRLKAFEKKRDVGE